jgi:hypothetical protein
MNNCIMTDDSRKRLFATIRDAGWDTRDKDLRLQIASAALSQPGKPPVVVTSFTELDDAQAALIVHWLHPAWAPAPQASATI